MTHCKTTVASSHLIQDAAQTALISIRQFASSVTEHQGISSIPGFQFRVRSAHEYHVLCGRAEAVGGHGTSRVSVRGFHECEVAVRVDVTTEPAFDKTTSLRREGEV